MRSLSRVLRLATVLSATPSSSSSPLARYESSTAGDMSGTLRTFSRTHLVRRRPGFVRSAIPTSSSRWTTRCTAHSCSQQASSPLATRPEVGRRGLHNLQREASHPTSRGTSALEQWFTPTRKYLGRLSQQRLFSAESPAVDSATVDADYISSPVRAPHSNREGGGGSAGKYTTLREDAGKVESGEGEGGEGEDCAAPLKVSHARHEFVFRCFPAVLVSSCVTTCFMSASLSEVYSPHHYLQRLSLFEHYHKLTVPLSGSSRRRRAAAVTYSSFRTSYSKQYVYRCRRRLWGRCSSTTRCIR